MTDERWNAGDYWIVPKARYDQHPGDVWAGSLNMVSFDCEGRMYTPDEARQFAARVLAAADEAERRATP